MTARRGPGLLRLAPLALVVLAVHLVVLQLPPDQVAEPRAAPPPLITRQVQAQAPPATAAAAAQARAAMPAAARPRPQPRRVQPEAAPPPVPTAAPSEDTPTVEAAEPAGSAPAPQATASTPQGPVAVPPSMRLRYTVDAQARGISLTGEGELLWRHDGNQYEARLQVSAPFVTTRVQTSTGRITAEGLQPQRFSDKTRQEEATHFERDKGKLVFSRNRPEAALLAGAQDRLSVVLQLAALLAGDPARYPPGSSIAIPTAGTRDAETWTFTVEAEEDLQLPGGAVRGLKLQRLPRRDYDYLLELWLAPSLDYAPVRLRLTYPNGHSLDQRWASTDKG
jgi:hypothetical protein